MPVAAVNRAAAPASATARYVAEKWDPDLLPEPLDPADLAAALWDLYLKRDRFEEVVG